MMRALALFMLLASCFGQTTSKECHDRYAQDLEAKPSSSLAHYRIAECVIKLRDLQTAANELRAALSGDLEPRWVEVWSRIYMGKIFDRSGQRQRALAEYRLAEESKDNTFHAQDEVARCKESPCKI